MARGLTQEQRKELGRLIRARREALGLGVAELDRRAGIWSGETSRLENGLRSSPSARTLQRLSVALGVELAVDGPAATSEARPTMRFPIGFPNAVAAAGVLIHEVSPEAIQIAADHPPPDGKDRPVTWWISQMKDRAAQLAGAPTKKQRKQARALEHLREDRPIIGRTRRPA